MNKLVLIHALGMPTRSHVWLTSFTYDGKIAPTTSALGRGVIAGRLRGVPVIHPLFSGD